MCSSPIPKKSASFVLPDMDGPGSKVSFNSFKTSMLEDIAMKLTQNEIEIRTDVVAASADTPVSAFA